MGPAEQVNATPRDALGTRIKRRIARNVLSASMATAGSDFYPPRGG